MWQCKSCNTTNTDSVDSCRTCACNKDGDNPEVQQYLDSLNEIKIPSSFPCPVCNHTEHESGLVKQMGRFRSDDENFMQLGRFILSRCCKQCGHLTFFADDR